MSSTSRTACSSLRRLFLAALVATSLTASGCVGVSRHLTEAYEAVFQRQREQRELAEIRQDTRDELSEQRKEAMRDQADYEIEQARLDAEQKQLEQALCVSNREQLQQQVKSQLRDKIQSKIAFDVTHALEVGELEVDVEQLKQLLKEREKQRDQPPRDQLNVGPEQKGCLCMQKACECGGAVQKRDCPRCCHKKCEPDCGGPAAYRAALTQPIKQPLRPTEIPLKLPVKLSFGMQNPEVEETKVRREPITEGPRDQLHDQPSQKGFPFQKDEPYVPSQKSAAVISDLADPPEPRTARIPTLPTPEPDNP